MILDLNTIDKNGSYTFSDYFSLSIQIDTLLNFFGFSFKNKAIDFKNMENFKHYNSLKKSISTILERVVLSGESSRREFLIAPVIGQLLVEFDDFQISTEKIIKFDNLLKGKLDYFLSTNSCFLVLEAKNENMESGLKQLATQMIAVDKILQTKKNQTKNLYGVISTGIEWKFVILDREKKEFLFDMNLYFLPNDLEKILGIIIKLLNLEGKK